MGRRLSNCRDGLRQSLIVTRISFIKTQFSVCSILFIVNSLRPVSAFCALFKGLKCFHDEGTLTHCHNSTETRPHLRNHVLSKANKAAYFWLGFYADDWPLRSVLLGE